MSIDKAAAFFQGWEQALIWSCLDGCMGKLIANDAENPTAALIINGDFCFFAGVPTEALLKCIGQASLLIPCDAAWQALIAQHFGVRARQSTRYAIKKEPNVFDRAKLTAYINSVPDGYCLCAFSAPVFEMAKAEVWSFDLCSQFKTYEDFRARAIGMAVLHEGALVAGASSYAVYQGGIEIEIDTKSNYRKQGLAAACGAALILECLGRNLYPSWDAHDLRSVALAEKLGYHVDRPYVTYELI